MRAAIRFDMSFVVNLDDEEVRDAVRIHEDARGDIAQASVIEARERVHAILGRSFDASGPSSCSFTERFDVDEVNVCEVSMSNTCDACEAHYTGDGFENPGGEILCGGCVNRALAMMHAQHVLDNIGVYDDATSRAIGILKDEDVRMRASNMPYVDSMSAAHDMFAGVNDDEVRNMLAPVFDVLVRATREPGTIIDR